LRQFSKAKAYGQFWIHIIIWRIITLKVCHVIKNDLHTWDGFLLGFLFKRKKVHINLHQIHWWYHALKYKLLLFFDGDDKGMKKNRQWVKAATWIMMKCYHVSSFFIHTCQRIISICKCKIWLLYSFIRLFTACFI
jgi:hypothetical protein